MEAEEKEGRDINTPSTGRKKGNGSRTKHEEDVVQQHKLVKTSSSDSVSASSKHRKHHKDSKHKVEKERGRSERIAITSPPPPLERHCSSDRAHYVDHGHHPKKVKSGSSSRHHSPSTTKRIEEPETSRKWKVQTVDEDEAIVFSQHHPKRERVMSDHHESFVGDNLSRSRDLEEEVEKLEELFVDDTEALFNHFDKCFGEVARELRKPNVLLTGITGAGKSTLINAVFGKNIAATGTGVPITQHFTKYESTDTRVVIYDSKGLEHGQYEDFIESTNEFFQDHRVDSTDAIHVIWYIINSAHSRFEPFEETICRKLFNKVPLLFILNKADLSSKEDRDGLRKIIEEMDLPNCVGVVDAIAHPTPGKVTIEACPKCGSDDIIIKKRQGIMKCESCNYEEDLQMNNGLEKVIEATTNALPVFVRVAFVSAQNVSFTMKERKSKQIISDFWKDYGHVRTPATLTKMVAKVMASISLVWDFKKHGKSYGSALAQEMVSSLGWKDKLSLFLHNKDMDSQRMHCVALAILWNQCLRTLASTILKTWSEKKEEKGDRKRNKENDYDRCADLFSSVFGRQFNDENLYLLETMIEDHGLEWVLAKQIHIAEEEGSGGGRGSNRSSSSFLPLPLSPELLSSSEIHRKKSLK